MAAAIPAKAKRTGRGYQGLPGIGYWEYLGRVLLARVRRTVRERRLWRQGDHLVVACSGGPDSVAMAHVLGSLSRELGVTLVVAAVDHGLRPGAAAEVEGVARLADALGLPFRPLRVVVPTAGPSVQAAARRARYEALRSVADAEGARRIAVGHTMDDQAETVLDRLLRGSGVEGLSGIAPRRKDGVVRPLIDCRREDVRRYVAHHGLWTVTDPSNEDRRFSRVRIRLDLVPALAAEDPAVVPHLARLADDARAASRLVAARGRRLLARSGFPASDPDVSVLRGGAEAARRFALRAWIVEFTGIRARRAHVEALERLLDGGAGEVLLGEEWGARVRQDRLVAERRARRTRSSRNDG